MQVSGENIMKLIIAGLMVALIIFLIPLTSQSIPQYCHPVLVATGQIFFEIKVYGESS